MNRVRYILTTILLSLFSVSFAQTEGNPLTWRMNVKMIDSTDGEVIVKCIPEAGWHVYGFKMPEGGPKPTSIDLSLSKGVEFIGPIHYSPDIVKGEDAMFGKMLEWWDTTVTFRRKFKVTDDNPSIVAKIKYMGCNNKQCLPPAEKTLTRTVKVKN